MPNGHFQIDTKKTFPWKLEQMAILFFHTASFDILTNSPEKINGPCYSFTCGVHLYVRRCNGAVTSKDLLCSSNSPTTVQPTTVLAYIFSLSVGRSFQFLHLFFTRFGASSNFLFDLSASLSISGIHVCVHMYLLCSSTFPLEQTINFSECFECGRGN